MCFILLYRLKNNYNRLTDLVTNWLIDSLMDGLI